MITSLVDATVNQELEISEDFATVFEVDSIPTNDRPVQGDVPCMFCGGP